MRNRYVACAPGHTPSTATAAVLGALALLMYPLGVPLLYSSFIFQSRHDLYRMRRFQLETESTEVEAKLRKASIDPLTLNEFQRNELLGNVLHPRAAAGDLPPLPIV